MGGALRRTLAQHLEDQAGYLSRWGRVHWKGNQPYGSLINTYSFNASSINRILSTRVDTSRGPTIPRGGYPSVGERHDHPVSSQQILLTQTL